MVFLNSFTQSRIFKLPSKFMLGRFRVFWLVEIFSTTNHYALIGSINSLCNFMYRNFYSGLCCNITLFWPSMICFSIAVTSHWLALEECFRKFIDLKKTLNLLTSIFLSTYLLSLYLSLYLPRRLFVFKCSILIGALFLKSTQLVGILKLSVNVL